MVEVKNLCKKYGDFVALDDLNFDVADGEVFGFVGPNGAGKTTTMRIMAGLNQPDRGSITIAGTDAVKNSKKIKRIIGYMPDFFGVYDNLKVIEYMEFYASIYGITVRHQKNYVKIFWNLWIWQINLNFLLMNCREE